jgi:hypothetical protein
VAVFYVDFVLFIAHLARFILLKVLYFMRSNVLCSFGVCALNDIGFLSIFSSFDHWDVFLSVCVLAVVCELEKACFTSNIKRMDSW